MPRKNTLIHTLFVNILASMLLLAFPAFSQTAPLEQHKAAKPLPTLEYVDSEGKTHKLAAKSRLTILHLWATWCAPCLDEIPVLDAVATAYKDKGVSVLALSLDGKNTDKVQDFYTKHNIKTLPSYFDYQMKVFRSLKLKGLPASIFIDENGKEIARIDGPADWKSAEVKKLLNQK